MEWAGVRLRSALPRPLSAVLRLPARGVRQARRCQAPRALPAKPRARDAARRAAMRQRRRHAAAGIVTVVFTVSAARLAAGGRAHSLPAGIPVPALAEAVSGRIAAAAKNQRLEVGAGLTGLCRESTRRPADAAQWQSMGLPGPGRGVRFPPIRSSSLRTPLKARAQGARENVSGNGGNREQRSLSRADLSASLARSRPIRPAPASTRGVRRNSVLFRGAGIRCRWPPTAARHRPRPPQLFWRAYLAACHSAIVRLPLLRLQPEQSSWRLAA